MNNNIEKIEIGFVRDTFLLSDQKRQIDTMYSENKPDELKNINDFFNELTKFNIIEKKENKKENCVVILLQNSKKRILVTINNYRNLKKKIYFKKFHNKIKQFNLNNIYNIFEKHKISVKSIILAGSLVSSATIVNFAAASNLDKSNEIVNEDIIVVENIDNNDIDYENDTNIDIPMEIPSENINENNYNLDIPIEITPEDITTIETPIIAPDSIALIKPNTEETKKQKENNNTNSNNVLDFSEIKNFKDYDDYIKFASNLYLIDYDILKDLVSQYFANPNGDILDLNIHSLDYMKELKQKGFIDGDLNVIYIIGIAKKYASKHTNFNELSPIISNKTVEEKESDLVNFAKYIYGINNLDLCFTIPHIEASRNLDSKLSVYHNNIGGIRSTKDFDSFPTFEVGIAEYTRVYLYNNYLAIHRDDYNPNMPMQYNMAKSYCTDSPEEWYTTITEVLENGCMQEKINECLGTKNKLY